MATLLLAGCNRSVGVSVFPDAPEYYRGTVTKVAENWTSNGDGWIEIEGCPNRVRIIGWPVGDYPGVHPTIMILKTVRRVEDLVGKQVLVRMDGDRALCISDTGERNET